MDDKQLVRIVLTTDEDYEEIKDSVMIGACLEEIPKRITPTRVSPCSHPLDVILKHPRFKQTSKEMLDDLVERGIIEEDD